MPWLGHMGRCGSFLYVHAAQGMARLLLFYSISPICQGEIWTFFLPSERFFVQATQMCEKRIYKSYKTHIA